MVSHYLQPLWQAVAGSELKLSQFYPTHINRNEALFQAGIEFAKAGGVIDFTASTTAYDLQHGEVAAAEALARASTSRSTSDELNIKLRWQCQLASV